MALTKGDLKQIGNLLDIKLDEQEEKFENKVTEIKSEFFEKIDPILQEVKTAREERPLIEARVEAIEQIHPEVKRSLAP